MNMTLSKKTNNAFGFDCSNKKSCDLKKTASFFSNSDDGRCSSISTQIPDDNQEYSFRNTPKDFELTSYRNLDLKAKEQLYYNSKISHEKNQKQRKLRYISDKTLLVPSESKNLEHDLLAENQVVLDRMKSPPALEPLVYQYPREKRIITPAAPTSSCILNETFNFKAFLATENDCNHRDPNFYVDPDHHLDQIHTKNVRERELQMDKQKLGFKIKHNAQRFLKGRNSSSNRIKNLDPTNNLSQKIFTLEKKPSELVKHKKNLLEINTDEAYNIHQDAYLHPFSRDFRSQKTGFHNPSVCIQSTHNSNYVPPSHQKISSFFVGNNRDEFCLKDSVKLDGSFFVKNSAKAKINSCEEKQSIHLSKKSDVLIRSLSLVGQSSTLFPANKDLDAKGSLLNSNFKTKSSTKFRAQEVLLNKLFNL